MKSERELLAPTQNRKQVVGPGPHPRPGVMLLNTAGQLLFMNDQVPLFFQRFQPASARELGTCLIPEEIGMVVRELSARLRTCEQSKECRPIHVGRVFDTSDDRLSIRGWCMPDERVVTKSRVLIVLETLRQPVASLETKIQDHYHLTEREQMVLIYLMLGFTNKEIANRLHLSEYTVKEHMKRMMQKTQTSSRTGLLSRMIFPLSERSGHLRALPLQEAPLTTGHPEEALAPVGYKSTGTS